MSKRERDDSSAIMRPQSWPHDLSSRSLSSLQTTLNQHHGVHNDVRLEWWYVNAQITNALATVTHGIFIAFFRLSMQDTAADAVRHTHAVNWGITDVSQGTFVTASFLDPDTPQILFQHLRDGTFDNVDRHARKALEEIAKQGRLPPPDGLLPSHAKCSRPGEPLNLSFAPMASLREAGGHFYLKVEGVCELTLDPQRFVLHGENGIVTGDTQKGSGYTDADMFYYFAPCCKVVGTLLGNQVDPGTSKAWFDHEFGGVIPTSTTHATAQKKWLHEVCKGNDPHWDWAALHMADGSALSVARLRTAGEGGDEVCFGVRVPGDPREAVVPCNDVTFRGLPMEKCWTSPETGIEYPICWELCVPSVGVQVVLRAAVAHQELISIAAKPSFWEGLVHVSGSHSGFGYVEVRVGQDNTKIKFAYDALRQFLCPRVQPLAVPDPEVTLNATRVAVLELLAALSLAMGEGVPSHAVHQEMICCGVAAYVTHRTPGCNPNSVTEWAQKKWDEIQALSSFPNTFRTLAVRAVMLFLCETPAVSATNQSLPKVPSSFSPTIPPDAVLQIPSSEESLVAFETATRAKKWRLNKSQSQSLGPLLEAQGVNIMIRGMTDLLVPDITFQRSGSIIHTAVILPIGTTVIDVHLDGVEHPWESMGRGTVKSRACLMESGRVIYVRTAIPAGHGVEHKWTFLKEDLTLVEILRFQKSNGDGEVTCARSFDLVQK